MSPPQSPGADERAVIELQRQGDVALLEIDHPPVNALSAPVVTQLGRAIDAFEADRGASALVIACRGRTFVAGGDIAGFDDPDFSAQPLNHVLARIEALGRPVIAAMHGHVLGGGLELALACHWRVAAPDTQFAMPEVELGLLPGSLGTQRLPRLIGVERALDLIGSGRRIDARTALAWGVIDEIAHDAPVAKAGLRWAAQLLCDGRGPRRTGDRSIDATTLPPELFDAARERARRTRAAYPAALAIVDAVEAAATRPWADGARIEAEAFERLRASPTSKALRHLFFARRQATKLVGVPAGTTARRIERVGVVGGGTMGRGIALSFLQADLPVVLLEQSDAQAQAAAAGVRDVLAAWQAKGRITPAQFDRRTARLTCTTHDASLATCDLVIEAVYEDFALKQSVCRRLGELCRPGAVIATNTSSLDVDALAQATGRPADVVGMHFFSPAHVMRLVEVVRGAATAPDVLCTAVQIAQRIGKQPVVCGVCWGFIGNRMLEVYLRETEFLLMEGATPTQIDHAIESLGLAMGPCRMLDLAGLDVAAKVVIEQAKAGQLPPDDRYRVVVRRLFELGRLGQKSGAGYYRYDGRTAVADPQVDEVTQALAQRHGVVRRDAITPQEIVERLLYPLINEGTKILAEGIASRAGDIDVVWTSGYGFPDHLGGPMCHADRVGLSHIAGRLEHYGRARGNAHGYWTPSDLLMRLASRGERLCDGAAARLPAGQKGAR